MSNTQSLEINIVPKTVFDIGGFKVTETMLSCALTVLVLIIFALIVRIFFIPRWEKESRKKSGFRIFLEYIINMFSGTADEQTGRNSGFTGAFYFSCSAFICVATLLEMLSFRPATTDLSLTIVFGFMTFSIIFFLGFKERRAKRLFHYLNPLNTLTDCVVPVSIALRMFGSVFCGFLIMHLIYSMLPAFIHYTGIVGAIGNIVFTAFHALIQAYVYMFLSMNLINEVSEH